MHLRGRTLKFTAVTAMVVLTLTGFSTGRGHGHGSSGSGGGGGGCSSSGQDHDSSSSTTSGGGTSGSGTYRDYDDDDYDDDSYGSGGGSDDTSTASLRDAEVRLISCATQKTPYATVGVTNPNDTGGTFSFDVTFVDEQADTVLRRSMEAYVPANNSTRVTVDVDDTRLLARIDHCQVDSSAPPVS